MFENSQNLLITGGTFTAQTIFPSRNEGHEGLTSIQDKIAVGAFHNSAERYDPPKCHPNTREIVLKKIMDWVRDANNFFMWLYGPAGAGKSAIAQTIADMCYTEGLLVASFFFSRNSVNRKDETLLITTIAYQLSIAIPETRERIGKAVELDPMILSKSLEAQIQSLIVEPLNEAALEDRSTTSRPRLIIIDGLDECGVPKVQRYILDTLLSASQKLCLPLLFLIASRPDPHIRDAFNQDLLNSLTTRIVLDDSYQPDDDIRVFLLSRFNDVKRKHPTLMHRRPPWPAPMDVELLVQKSSGQFIYASTVMKYVDSHHHWPPDRLDIAFGLSMTDDNTPLAELDRFYHHILSSVADIGRVIDFFMFLLLVQFWTKTRNIVEDFLFLRRGELDIVLCDLHSLVSIPEPEDESTELRVFHASFPDFLLDRSRSGKFHLNAASASARIVRYCIRHFKDPNVMCQDGINHHNIRSLFMLQILTAEITTQLLDDVCDVDMGMQLSFWTSDDNVIGVYEHDNKRLISFLMWLASQHHRGMSLLRFFNGPVDQWILSRIRDYPHQYLFNLLLTAGTLTNFTTTDIFTILGPESVATMDINSSIQKPRRFDPLQIYSPKDEYKPFYSILTEFLRDASRSKDFYVGENHYATLSIYVAVFLIHNIMRPPPVNTNPQTIHPRASQEAQKLGCYLLTESLLKSPNSPDLARVLQNYNPRIESIAPLNEDIEKSVGAAFEYLRSTYRDSKTEAIRTRSSTLLTRT
ncbi:hypothetical protein JR316_0011810 [Psilocybe cubensis]|uniref:Uncharacterized protein n=1 Tax=Psilocybe cubensis TaxID=181762 RepID=A0ACB8GMH1_PSICU|nr:hypothetical protein JR316_0011810 [Psilocybe cubensis]KAH9476239.1 hypothetical protein JR316_0011810 [Psilocybe cubensis]